jgi:Putative zinc-finger
MCDERERLIGYVYDECDADERRQIDDHLSDCPTCRREIGALRHVRQDLLAWDVPPNRPVWRPEAPVSPRTSLLRQVPAWALAAAAGLVLMAGAAGGAATAALSARPTPAGAAAEAVPAPVALPAAVTPADLDALEQKVLAKVRTEMDDRIRLVAAHDTSPAPAVDQRFEKISRQIDALKSAQSEFSSATYADFLSLRKNQRSLEQSSNFILTSMAVPAGR